MKKQKIVCTFGSVLSALIFVSAAQASEIAQNKASALSVFMPIGLTAKAIGAAEAKHKAKKADFVASQKVYQCTAILPTPGASFPGALTNLYHVFVQTETESYGMPYTNKGTYMGGDASIYSPDAFVGANQVKGVKCLGVYHSKNVEDDEFEKNFSCLADQMALGSSKNDQGPSLLLNYHALKKNCQMASRFLIECAGGMVSQYPNFNIGGKVNWNQSTYYVDKNQPRNPRIEAMRIQISDMLKFSDSSVKRGSDRYLSVDTWKTGVDTLDEDVKAFKQASDASNLHKDLVGYLAEPISEMNALLAHAKSKVPLKKLHRIALDMRDMVDRALNQSSENMNLLTACNQARVNCGLEAAD